jgi:hypothetical protein
MVSMASAEPRRSECTCTTSPRRTYASNEPIVTVWGEIADVDRSDLREVGIRRPADQRHDTARAEPLREHRREDVRFLRVRERTEHVDAVDVFLDQQLLVRRVAHEHERVAEVLRDVPGALRLALDDLHLVLLVERLREPEADVAAARDHDALDRVLRASASPHDDADVLRRRDEEHLVAVEDLGVAIGLDALALAVHRRDTRLAVLHVRAQLADRASDQRAALERLEPTSRTLPSAKSTICSAPG